MPDEPADERRPLRVFCDACAFKWTLLYLPMPVDDVAAIARGARCPMCASPRVVIGPNQP